MNRRVLLLIVGSLSMGLTLGSAPSLTAQVPPVLRPSELCSDHPDTAIATFEDRNLEAQVRSALAVGEQDDLTCGLVSGLTGLDAERAGIVSLVGIQNLTSMTRLNLFDTSITDISALSGLTSLTYLSLWFNSISDISALSGLTSLTTLNLIGNSISDISTLSGLTSLTLLLLGDNPISDISQLSGLTSLTLLSLDDNSITNIGVLSGLTSLTFLFLPSNQITDISALSRLTGLTRLLLDNNPDLSNIQPLLDNTGLGADDTVNLRSTNVSCTDVAALEAKGVTVESDCP